MAPAAMPFTFRTQRCIPLDKCTVTVTAAPLHVDAAAKGRGSRGRERDAGHLQRRRAREQATRELGWTAGRLVAGMKGRGRVQIRKTCVLFSD